MLADEIWVFERERARAPIIDQPDAVASGYDEGRFARDLNLVADEALLSLSDLPERLLSFSKGEKHEVALAKVVTALVLRSFDGAQDRIRRVLGDAKQMLLEKNAAYGDSALNPVRVFATASPMEQLLVRLDDKVSRLERGKAAGEDVAHDLLGYLLLVLIAQKRETEKI